jgi:RNA polymerase sigma factor (sigma-70 family)
MRQACAVWLLVLSSEIRVYSRDSRAIFEWSRLKNTGPTGFTPTLGRFVPAELERTRVGFFRPGVNRPSSLSSAVAPKEAPDDELTALVIRAQGGDLGAQSELVRRYTRRISGFVRRIVSQRSAVEDVVQTVFIKMIRRLGLLREPRVFESWLFTLSRNTALDFIRRRRCQPATVSADFHLLSVPDSSSAQAVDEILAALDRALARLSAKDRQLVTLIVQGHSYGVVAEREGISVGAVKLRMHRVRPFLRLSVREAIGARPSTKTWHPPTRGWLAA